MADIILHHYAPSLFSEKIRLLLGYLGLEWRSVIISPTMPRPLLMPLTGGYRRTPVMQEGADIYCDSRVIAERLAVRAGKPELCEGFLPNRVAEWADSHLFRVGVAIMFQPRAMVSTMRGMSQTDAETFRKDRAELSKGASIVTISPPAAESHLRGYLLELDASLKSPFLFGASPTIADFSVYHCLWFVNNNPVIAPILDGYPNVSAWRSRMAAFGHGKFEEITAEVALGIGRDSKPAPVPRTTAVLPDDIAIGDRVGVTPTDYGLIPVTGELVTASAREYAVRRTDETAGEVVVHFPRVGFTISK